MLLALIFIANDHTLYSSPAKHIWSDWKRLTNTEIQSNQCSYKEWITDILQKIGSIGYNEVLHSKICSTARK